MRSWLCVTVLTAVLLAPAARAGVPAFNPADLSALSSDNAAVLIQTVAIGADHHDYMPATPLGVTLGFDLGVEATAVNVPQDFLNAMALATGQASGQIPQILPVPKLSIHKGLPFGLDVGFSWVSIPDTNNPANPALATSYGADVKWAFMRGGVARPAIALRLSGSYNTVSFLTTHTYAVSALIGKNFYIIDPYAGAGYQFWSGSINVPVGIPGLPSTVSANQSGANPEVFAGAALKLVVVKLTAQIDYSFAGVMTYGGKFSIGF